MDPIKTAASGAPPWVTYTALTIAILGFFVALMTFIRGELRWRHDREAVSLRFRTRFVARPDIEAGELHYLVSNFGKRPALDFVVVLDAWQGSTRLPAEFRVGDIAAGAEDVEVTAPMVLQWTSTDPDPEWVEFRWRLKPNGRVRRRRAGVVPTAREVQLYRPWSLWIRERLVRRLGGMTATSHWPRP